MRRPRSTDCAVGQHQYPSVSQRCSYPLQDSRSWTSSSSCRCRCRRPVVVWIALAMLLGCRDLADASTVLPPTSTPTTDVEGRPAGDRLSRSSLLLLRPASSRLDNSYDRAGSSVDEDFSEVYNVRHRHRRSHSASETCRKRSRYNTRRRRRRTRSTLKFVILFCHRISRKAIFYHHIFCVLVSTVTAICLQHLTARKTSTA